VTTSPRRRLSLLTAVAAVAALAVPNPASPADAAPGGSDSPAVTGSPDDYDGSDLWLRYAPVQDRRLRAAYRETAAAIVVPHAERNPVHRHTPDLRMEPGSRERLVTTSLEAARDELSRGLRGLLGRRVPTSDRSPTHVPDGAVVVGTPQSSSLIRTQLRGDRSFASVGEEGYVIRSVRVGRSDVTLVAGHTEVGALYGTYGFLRLLQTHAPVDDLDVTEEPKVQSRQLNNWEEVRLYAGNDATGTGGLHGEDGTIFNFDATGASADRNLPVILDRYITTARALASVGINGIEINLVNADNRYLTPAYIEMEAALADALRPYGIKISLAINYTAPTDPRFAPDTLTEEQLDPYSDAFRGWWRRKATQIQDAIPDFTGFTVKANSEGQPGPQDFGYDHGDGANGIAAAVAPLGMTIYWRTFVYNPDVDPDRLKRAYLEFGPIDDEPQPDGSTGRFADNVLLQTKNGPLDFQAREPINPMFGRMENTNQALELQITQEYTGQSTYLTYLGPMWQEALHTDTHATDADGAPLARSRMGDIVDGTAQGQQRTAIVGVANLGNADNLTGHHFAQSNLYAFGRLAWDWTTDARDIAEEWTRMTWSNDEDVVDTILTMMMGSWEAVVSYQTPLGMHHQFEADVHYGPGPDETLARPDWSPTYYNNADAEGLGYDRSPSGSNFTAQYFPVLEQQYGDLATVPENLMMWFHHVPWQHPMRSGLPFWDELVHRYQMGVQYVTAMRDTWDSLQGSLDRRRFTEVAADLKQQEIDAAEWRDVCVEYWRSFSKLPMPTDRAPLSASVEMAGQTYDGFDLSADSYTLEVPAGADPEITGVTTHDPRAAYEIVQQADGVPGRAVVKVSTDSFFGPITKYYAFDLVAAG